MIEKAIKLHLSETLLQQVDKYTELAVRNKFTAAASLFQRVIQSGDIHFEQEAKVGLFDMMETELRSYEGEG